MIKETKRITKKATKKLTALLLSIIMMLSGLVSVLAFDDRGHEQPINEASFDNNAMISEARQKYYELLGGNYWSVELPDRFRELFGDISPEYILYNYTTIFDISSEEMDQAVLRVLTQGAETLEREREERWLDDMERFEEWEILLDLELEETSTAPLPQVVPFSDDAHYDMAAEVDLNALENYEHAIPLNTAEVHIEFVSATNTTITLNLFFNPRNNASNNMLRYYDFTAHNPPFNGAWVDLLGQPVGRPTLQSGIHTITGLTPGATYRFLASTWDASAGRWVDHEMMATTTGGGIHSLQITNRTQNSLTINVTFPVERESGNRLRFFNGSNWVDFVSNPTGNLTSGSYTISGLSPGITYRVLSQHMNRIDGEWSPQNTMNVILPMPSERLVRFTPNAPVNMIFYLDQEIVNAMGSRVNTFVNATNRGYAINHDLVGGTLPFNGAPMELRNTRSLPHPIEGTSGQPIYWQVTGIPGVSLSGIDHAHAMNRFNANTTETPFHEIGHNFDSHRWSFCEEAIGTFMIYHYYDRTNERMAVANQSQVWVGGHGYRTYIRSHANRFLGHTNYDVSIARGIYSPYGLAWNLANIQTQIGWEPFRQTFRHFHTLTPQQVPARDIDKFNYFLSRLQDYSGRNVFAMFNANERAVYQAHFGGTMSYVNPAPQNITLTFNSNNRGITPNPAPLTRTPGTTMGNMPSQPVWTNHRFLGWFDTSGPTGGNQLTSTARVPDRNTTYYARWEATVVFDASGGTLSGNGTVNAVVGSRITLPTPLPPVNWSPNNATAELDNAYEQYDTRAMIIFTGWRMQNGDPIIGSTMEVRESTRLVAGWNFPVDANLSDGIYRIKRPNGTHLNVVSSNGNISFTLNTHINNNTGADLWYIESTGDGRHYTIESIGIRGPNLGASPYVLSARSIIDQQLTLTASSGSIAQQWRIMRQGADLFFINRAFPNTRINVTDGTVAISNNQSGSEWRLEEYTRTFYMSGRYVQFMVPNEPIAMFLGLTPSAIINDIGLTRNIYNSYSYWNGITPNVTISLGNAPVTPPGIPAWPEADDNPHPRFSVRVEGYDFSNSMVTGIIGEFRPDGQPGGWEYHGNNNWSWGVIRMDIGTGPYSLHARAGDSRDMEKVFLHEIGHALKLWHPHEMSLNDTNFPGGWRPVSIMTTGLPGSTHPNDAQTANTPIRPHSYDKHNLIRKWGE